MSWKLTGKNADGTDVNYEDLPVRIAVSDFVKEVFGWNVISNNNDKFAIDLISEDGNCPDIECERSNCKKSDYWQSKGFSEFLRDATPAVKYRTLNFQARKEHYWIEGDHYKKRGSYWYTEKNHLTNLFIRTTYYFDQMLIIRPETIRDESKVHRALKKPFNIHKNELEPWLGFRRKDVETYNKINGLWVKDETIEQEK
jgi:hypothetical protein